MRELVEAKRQQAEQQAVLWRQNLLQTRRQVEQAEQQIIRWEAIGQALGELLAEDAEAVAEDGQE